MRKALDRLSWRLGDSSPIWTAFLGSLLLSLVAILGSSSLNKDGMIYVDAARNFMANGYSGLFGTFDWPMLSLLMAWLSKLTGLGLETAGHTINALFLAGTCALMVDLVRRRQAEAAWISCLVVLSIPGVNGYRDQLLREYGFWFFSILAFWLATYWERDRYRWPAALLCQAALMCAVLFRFEAVLFFPALALWQTFSAPRGEKLGRIFKIACLPIIAGAVLLVVFAAGGVAVPWRLKEYYDAANVFGISKVAQQAARLVESGILPKYSSDEAGYILLVGLLAVVPLKFLSALGVFCIPLVYGFVRRPIRDCFERWAPLPWAFLAHLVALSGFAIHRLFVLARHAGPLSLLVIPVVADGMLLLMKRFPGWKTAIIAASLLTMAANVITLGPGHAHQVLFGTSANMDSSTARSVENTTSME